jgi:hypothetical protein
MKGLTEQRNIMRNLFILFLFSILILFASCSSKQQAQNGFSDDVYFSSKDRAAEKEKAQSAIREKQSLIEQKTPISKRARDQAYGKSEHAQKNIEKRRERTDGERILRPVARALVEIALWSILWHHSWSWPHIYIEL